MAGVTPGSSCVVCGEPINAENDSKEHVINEAIGGRVKVKGSSVSPAIARLAAPGMRNLLRSCFH